jgi:hypothetical protein
MQVLQIDLCVDPSGIDVLMSQHRADLGKRCAFPQNVASEFMTKLIGCGDRRVEPRLLEATLNLRPDATCDVEISNRCVGARKNMLRRTFGSAVAQVRRNRPADIRRERRRALAGLAVHGQFSNAPMDVIEFQEHHFAGPPPNPSRASRITWSRRPIALFQSMLPRSH